MKNLLQKWNSLSLIVRILIGLIIGAILGVAAPKATGLALLGDLFVGALRAVAPILVFVLVIASLANSKSNGAKNMRIVIINFYWCCCRSMRKFSLPNHITSWKSCYI